MSPSTLAEQATSAQRGPDPETWPNELKPVNPARESKRANSSLRIQPGGEAVILAANQAFLVLVRVTVAYRA